MVLGPPAARPPFPNEMANSKAFTMAFTNLTDLFNMVMVLHPVCLAARHALPPPRRVSLCFSHIRFLSLGTAQRGDELVKHL